MDNNKYNLDEDKLQKFNNNFDKYKYIISEIKKLDDKNYIQKLNQEEKKEKPQIIDLTVGEILINLKDTWFEILDDILSRKMTLSVFTKGNRLFYIGITIFIFAIILYLYNLLSASENSEGNNANGANTNLTKVYYINRRIDVDNKFRPIALTPNNL